jgi:hypothetical protein
LLGLTGKTGGLITFENQLTVEQIQPITIGEDNYQINQGTQTSKVKNSKINSKMNSSRVEMSDPSTIRTKKKNIYVSTSEPNSRINSSRGPTSRRIMSRSLLGPATKTNFIEKNKLMLNLKQSRSNSISQVKPG